MSCLWLVAALITTSADAPVVSGTEVLLSDKGSRLRWGVSAGAGTFFPVQAYSLAVEARLGYQVSRRFSVFAAGGPAIAIASGFNFPRGFLSLIAEYAPVDFFFFGGGPTMSYGRVSSFGLTPWDDSGLIGLNDGTNQTNLFKPGFDLRVGLGFGQRGPPSFRRAGFTIGLNLQMLIHSYTQLLWTPQFGRRPTETLETIATFTPMLTLGYDSR